MCEVHQCVANIWLMLGVASLTSPPRVNLPHRLQMETELRQREHEREREKEREREAKGLEREREDELDRQKDRQRDRQQQMARAVESHYLAELQARRAPPEERARPGERLTPNRPGTYI